MFLALTSIHNTWAAVAHCPLKTCNLVKTKMTFGVTAMPFINKHTSKENGKHHSYHSVTSTVLKYTV